MKDNPASCVSRRRFLTSGILAAAAGVCPAHAAETTTIRTPAAAASGIEPFRGAHQAGIITPAQRHTYFAAFDLAAAGRDGLVKLLKTWTDAAARLTGGDPAADLGSDEAAPGPDSGEAMGLSPQRLTITFGFGAGMFTNPYGLASQRPEALVDLPRFNGDQLAENFTGGDLSVQACAEDPQVAFHAVRQLARLGADAARLRWVQSGFLPNTRPGETPRNLMGFKDGTNNPSTGDAAAMGKFIWVDGPEWLRGGSYLVARRIRIALEHWDKMKLGFQEQTMGRCKYSGAPIGGAKEFDEPDYDATDKDGNPVIAENAHIRLASHTNNDGAKILRRPYSYNDGANFTTERWPPWRQDMEYDAGLFFLCYQRDPRTGFIKLFEKMAKFDMMNQFVTHTGSGLFACPGGIGEGEFVGQKLFG
ncbi:MAG TPA: iron uptake transporter deferrochelatase/peroxidase subunit [Chthoniobacteraceae bacterium]|jgi:deferrochelatase/peroxidase EfeB|nr:iron uptake transporter deferrochelatase/peroxidase subunit [Chthoniobacteraceae bacterium]